MRQALLVMTLIAAGVAHAIEAPAPRPVHMDEQAMVEQDKLRTYAEIGAENGFTKEQWSRFYDEMQGFRYVNGLLVRDLPIPVRHVAQTRK